MLITMILVTIRGEEIIVVYPYASRAGVVVEP